jgi:hypothetical protein
MRRADGERSARGDRRANPAECHRSSRSMCRRSRRAPGAGPPEPRPRRTRSASSSASLSIAWVQRAATECGCGGRRPDRGPSAGDTLRGQEVVRGERDERGWYSGSRVRMTAGAGARRLRPAAGDSAVESTPSHRPPPARCAGTSTHGCGEPTETGRRAHSRRRPGTASLRSIRSLLSHAPTTIHETFVARHRPTGMDAALVGAAVLVAGTTASAILARGRRMERAYVPAPAPRPAAG